VRLLIVEAMVGVFEKKLKAVDFVGKPLEEQTFEEELVTGK